MVAAEGESSAEDERRQAAQRLAAIPGFEASAADARLTRLPGLTNRVYRVDTGGGRFVLRLPGEGTAALIDRRREEINARAAASAAVGPEVLHFGADGVMLTRFIEAEPLTRERLAADTDALRRVGAMLRRLHDTVAAFAGRFDAFATIDAYATLLVRLDAPLTARQHAILGMAAAARRALAVGPPPLRACHCDPTGRNLLDDGKRVWLVDWEYSGMNDPAWDLAYCSIQSRLPPEGDDMLLQAWLGEIPGARLRARFAVMKAPVELMSALWARIQDAQGNRAADFRAYAESTFEAAAGRMQSPAFLRAAAILDGG